MNKEEPIFCDFAYTSVWTALYGLFYVKEQLEKTAIKTIFFRKDKLLVCLLFHRDYFKYHK